ncbi:MAG: Mov34/MPN/PAD-1 family protein [Candidatus Thermoplasmatota archaeon]
MGSPKKPWRITKRCLDLILESSKDVYPNEFGGLLRVSSFDKTLIYEIVMLPGTVSGSTHAIFKMHMKPIDFSIIGTVHSHPSPSYHPSDADLHLFQKSGRIHIIVANPFNYDSWMAYNGNGEKIKVEIV